MLANLDNEVIFKKAFTDRIVFHAFVKDVLGIDVEIKPDYHQITAFREYSLGMGNISTYVDIHAESQDRRNIVQIQRIVYDHFFDYSIKSLLMSIAILDGFDALIRMNKHYYVVIILIPPYKEVDTPKDVEFDHEILRNVYASQIETELKPVFNYTLKVLNPYHSENEDSIDIKDWLNLFYQSMDRGDDSTVNLNNPGIKRVAEIIDTRYLTPTEHEKRLRLQSTRAARKLRENIAEEQGRVHVKHIIESKKIHTFI